MKAEGLAEQIAHAPGDLMLHPVFPGWVPMGLGRNCRA
jgi:hypothetical protein